MRKILVLLSVLSLVSCKNVSESPLERDKPNVVFILTDDQGYGDLGCNGNEWIQTPNIDSVYNESLSFTDYHVGTTCAPSRGGLMTGKFSNNVGVWHTIMGREILNEGEPTMAEFFKENAYKTSMFGKWHLGDNYPFRPQDRGFDESVIHKGGGVGQQPDYWNNDYFSDTYFRNGVPEKFEGYCTDIWFAEAQKFIEKSKDEPFFCYIALNAPHSPYNVPSKYSDLYKGQENILNPEFYGMITNIDENVGKLRAFLAEKELAENTIFIYMSDNGTAAGVSFDKNGDVKKGFNAGMRGTKGSEYEGGHRVPFIMHWPKGELSQRKDINALTSYVDFFPTLADLCGLPSPSGKIDGISLKNVIYNNENPDRVLVVDTQREDDLIKWKQPSIMKDKWRMIGKNELYDIKNDPGQKVNLAEEYPALMDSLKTAYESWWKGTETAAAQMTYIPVGSEVPELVQLNSHDLHTPVGHPTWNQSQVRSGSGAMGYWPIEVKNDGKYEVELCRWPKESGLGLRDAAPVGDEIPGKNQYKEGEQWLVNGAELIIDENTHVLAAPEMGERAVFTLDLKKGKQIMKASFKVDSGDKRQVFYAYVKPLNQ